MQSEYLGFVRYEQALSRQQETAEDTIFGFEPMPVVTWGYRADPVTELLWSKEEWQGREFRLLPVDRGGLATIHNPGQLVIFPAVEMQMRGARELIERMGKVTRLLLKEEGCEARWDKCQPGLYTELGKIASVGIRIRQGRTFHGLALNVRNDLAAFSGIRVCGAEAGSVDRLGGDRPLSDLFQQWMRLWLGS
ncbi:MAG: lipoyl(octanoyl) transferase LipB [Bdellovibrionales bacterium]